LGAKVTGAGSGIIQIEGVKKLHKAEHRIIPDRIEAGTYILMAATNCTEVDIINFDFHHNSALISKMIESNIKFRLFENKIRILNSPDLLPIEFKTNYFPGFPTDLQQVFLALLTKAKGISTVQDNIYKNRFKNCFELNKLNARIIVDNNLATIYGARELSGTTVNATDLRGGASLILAGLMAEGETVINHADHVFRGYSGIVEKIQKIKGNIRLL
jgi:UDP-N-acetylglucosamine 1-carboxyvinyltransferase